MYKIKLSPVKLKQLKKRKSQAKDKKTFRRLQCIYLKHKGKRHKEIADIIGVCQDTITDWIKLYKEKGINGLCDMNFDRRQSKIDPYLNQIKQDLKDNIISTLAELQDWLKNKYSIEIEQSWLSKCCKKKLITLTKKHIPFLEEHRVKISR